MSIADGENPLRLALPLFLVQMMLIITASRVLGYFLKYVKQPQVVAEIITGIILGPSVLGHIPGYSKALFPKESLDIMEITSNVGLIFFMFLIGLELDPSLLKRNLRRSCAIAISSMIVPFGAGAILSVFLYNVFLDDTVKFSTFLLFVGVAMCITAFPVLARILSEEQMTGSDIGILALSAAAINDIVAWILLALVVSIARANSHLSTLWSVLIMTGFFLFLFYVVRPLLDRYNRNNGEKARGRLLVITFLLILGSAWVTEVIGIHAIFGGFLMGVIIPREGSFAHYLMERIEDIIVVLFLPLYFTFSGLRTSLGDLTTWGEWGTCILVIAVACFGKIAGTVVPSRLLGHRWRESFTLGILMNTKGLVELIVLNIGLDVGVLTPELFNIFVMMALVTTMTTSPAFYLMWIKPLRKNHPSEADYDSLP